MKNKILVLILIAAIGLLAGCGRNAETIESAVDDKPITSQKSVIQHKGSLRLPIARLREDKKEALLVSSGIPFAPGRIYSDGDIAFFDDANAEVSIATSILARWPQDGSVRSILVQFSIDIPHKYTYLTMKWGVPRAYVGTPKEVGWEIPDAIVRLPALWLCESLVSGEQLPISYNRATGKPLTKYDQNIVNNFMKISTAKLKGDVRKDDYYDITHVFYQLYIRSGDEMYFQAARREAVRYREEHIIKDGPERGRAVQRKETRYIYVEGMVDDYLLTGDRRSLEVATYMAEYLKRNCPPEKAFFPKKGTRFWTEREQAFPFLGIITYYQLTGDKEYFDIAKQFMANLYRTQNEWPGRGGFIHNLYSHDPEEGARQDEYGGSPFMTGLLLEAIVKYHQLTNSSTAKDSIFKALNWLMKDCLAPDGDSFIYLTCDKRRGEGHPDLNMLIVHAFGYGYRISGYERKDYLELGQKLFERGMNSARLSDRKHFNQNYRSSGHFLAYIVERKKE